MTTWILLRGLTREQGHWGGFIDALQRALPQDRLLPLDLPGAGMCHRCDSPLNVPAMVAACRQQVSALGIAPPVGLIGLSMGGMVAADWALGWPGEVAGCVLINSSTSALSPVHHRLRPATWPRLPGLLLRRDALAIEATVLSLTSRAALASDARGPLLAHWAQIRRARPVRWRNALRQLIAAARYRLPSRPMTRPALVLCSLGDQLVDPACSLAIARQWGCPVASHASAGHDLPLDDGDWVAGQIQAWAMRALCSEQGPAPAAAH
jgi:pimeloyl-ACP methyl ester carboxylesterase